MYVAKTAAHLPGIYYNRFHSFRTTSYLVSLCSSFFMIAGVIANAQTTPPGEIVYTTGSGSGVTGTSQLLFNSVNPVLVPPPEAAAQPSLFVQKMPGQSGLLIADNNSSDTSFSDALNIEMFNIGNVVAGNRGGIRVEVDSSNSAPPPSGKFLFANLAGIEIGNHAPHTVGLWVQTRGQATEATNTPTQGVGIISQSWGLMSIHSTEGDQNHITSTEGAFFLHNSTGNVLHLDHATSNMSGDFIQANASADGTGSFTGNFLNFNVMGNQVFKVDANGDITIPSLKANSGTRFICIDTTGKLISQTIPCSGT